MPPLTFRADASYLITGGLGGFGLAVARWMAERGAGHLFLAGRRGITDENTRRTVEAVRRAGSDVSVLCADVSQPNQSLQLLACIRDTDRPLRGIIHAAMDLEDRLVADWDEAHVTQSLARRHGALEPAQSDPGCGSGLLCLF